MVRLSHRRLGPNGDRVEPGPPVLSTGSGALLFLLINDVGRTLVHCLGAFAGALLIGPHIEVSTLCDESLHFSTV
jgi:hypothetical protein